MKKRQINPRVILFFITFLLIVTFLVPLANFHVVQAIEPVPYYEPIDRFGITVPYPSSGTESLIQTINARAVLDWRIENNYLTLPDNVEYIHVIRVNDTAWGNGALLSTLQDIIERNLGGVWIIGNEPDRKAVQDSITPEVYAQRYYEIALRIRHIDQTAQIGFGSVVQPTPIRIRYLERALNYLTYLSCGNRQAALDLIDIWSIHAFILNENYVTGSWGADTPPGFVCPQDCYDIFIIENDEFYKTYSIDIFTQRIIDFRNWMYSIGERNKPLWITEYGSLFPPIDPPGGPNYVNVSDDVTAQFMVDTFDFMMTDNNPLSGFSADGNRLVQRWFWYSLNEYRYVFGGSLFDPDYNYNQTIVGQAFESYTSQIVLDPPIGDNPVLYRQSVPLYSVYLDNSSGNFYYPYQVCYRTQLPLVFK